MFKLQRKAREILNKGVLLFGVLLLTIYAFYRASFINFAPGIVVFSLLLFIAELHTMFHLYGMFYSLWPRNYKKYKLNNDKNLHINMFICVCGEPAAVVERTIQGAKLAAEHYKKTVGAKFMPQIYVLNDGKVAKKDNWKEIEALAKKYKVNHIARTIPGGFKAGNLNNALAMTKSKDPFNTIDVVFDSDFAAKKNFLIEMTKPFQDKTVDFAQSPQRYANEESWVAKTSAAHQIFFFDYICPAKGHDNALFLCGTNFGIRRSALNAIGGLDTRYITEDYATSLELHLKGMKGVFIPKVLAIGMAPTSLKQYFSQQQRWSKGSMDVSRDYLKRILFGPMTLKQKFHYMLSATYYLIGVRDLILMIAPLPYLIFGIPLIKANTWQYLMFVYTPLLVFNFILYVRLFRHPLKSIVLDIASFPVFVAAFLSAALKKNLSFIVTIKKYEKENPFQVYKLQLMVVALLVIGLFIGAHRPVQNAGTFLNFFWASYDASILSLGFYLIVRENYNTKKYERMVVNVFHKISEVLYSPRRIVRFGTITTAVLLGIVSGYLVGNLPLFSKSTLARVPEVQTVLSPDTQRELLTPSRGVYYGYYEPVLDTHPLTVPEGVVSGEKTSLVMFYQDWSEDTFDSSFLERLSANGRTPIITWEPWDSSKNTPDGQKQNEYSVQSIIDGKHDGLIRSFAKAAAAYKQPFFLRFAHEMNGDWYPWSSKYNTPKEYITMWRHVHDIFVAEGATNAIWVWSPNNTDINGNADSALLYYPGDAYVDWVGFSGFNWGASTATRWTPFTELTNKIYDNLSSINKPVMVAETSTVSVGGNKEKWFSDLAMNLPHFDKIKAVVFFDANINGADFSLTSGADFNKVAQKNILDNSYFLKQGLFIQK